MSHSFQEGALEFRFPDAWLVCRPAESPFYRRHFSGFAGGCREVDFLIFDPNDRALWLLEVKDFSRFNRTNPEPLSRSWLRKFAMYSRSLPQRTRIATSHTKRDPPEQD